MKLIKFAPKKNVAQAMVEFAIVLPILLLLLYGLLEVGRLLFMYSNIMTASRQAARYGATTGDGGNYTSEGGPDNSGVRRYQDCYGIRKAANKVDYLNAFNHTGADITITYDNGVDNSGNPIAVTGWDGSCDGNTDALVAPSGNNTRIKVTVTGHFNAIVRLVPLPTRTIVSSSSRTILTSISIGVPTSSSGSASTKFGSASGTSPNPSAPGQAVTAIATIENTTGSTTPTGTVEVAVEGVVKCTITLSGGTGSCQITSGLETEGNYDVTYTYIPSGSFTAPTPITFTHVVGKVPTTIAVTGPAWTLVNSNVSLHITVNSSYGTPTGTVNVSSSGGSCAVSLASGQGDCVLNFSTAGDDLPITFVYGGDTEHLSSSATVYLDVTTAPATSTNPPPATAIATTAVVTAVPTAVSNCNSIRDTIAATTSPIKYSTNTMYINIPNANPYPVTVSSIYVAWNYDKGHIGSNSNLKLMNATLDGNIIWQVTTGIHQPNYTISSFSSPAIIPPNGTYKLVFTFDQTYNKYSGEQIQIQFATPGCEPYPVMVPVGASTPIAPPSLNVQMISGGTDNNQQSQFHYRIQNTGSSAVTNISVRIYFTLDGSNAASGYVLEKYWDQSGVATVSPTPTLASGSVYYFTINYGSASLTAGSVWEFNTSLHLSSWASTYDSTNDWWHGSGTLPSSWADWTSIPLYINGSLVEGTPP